MALLFADPPVLRRFENDLDTGKIQLEWTRIGRDFYFRPKNARIELVWCHLGRGGYASDLLRAKPAISTWTTQNIKRSLAGFDVWRAAFLEDCDLFFQMDFGVVRLPAKIGIEQEFARFDLSNHFSSPHNRLTSASELQSIIRDSLSEIKRLKNVLNQPRQSRVLWSINWLWGTQEELERLLLSMAIIVRQPQNDSEEWHYQLMNNFRGNMIWNHYDSNSKVDVPLCEPFFNCLKRYFPVEISCQVIYTIHNIGDLHHGYVGPLLNLSTKNVTAHEKLEALLTWRDFLRDKIPATEIDELLRPFC